MNVPNVLLRILIWKYIHIIQGSIHATLTFTDERKGVWLIIQRAQEKSTT